MATILGMLLVLLPGVFVQSACISGQINVNGTCTTSSVTANSGLFYQVYNSYGFSNGCCNFAFFSSNPTPQYSGTGSDFGSYTFNANSTVWNNAWGINQPVVSASIQITGHFLAPTNGTYTFYAYADDYAWLWFGSSASNPGVSNTASNHLLTSSYTWVSGTVYLTAGVYYPFLMYYSQGAGPMSLQFAFQVPGSSNKLTDGTGYFFSSTGNIPSCNSNSQVYVANTCCSTGQNSGTSCCPAGLSALLPSSVAGSCCPATNISSVSCVLDSKTCAGGTINVNGTCSSPSLAPYTGLFYKVYNGYGFPISQTNLGFFAANPTPQWTGLLTDFGLYSPGSVSIPNWVWNNQFGIVQQSNLFSIQISGYFLPNSTGDYTFYLFADDLAYLWIGSSAVNPGTSNTVLNSLIGGPYAAGWLNSTINLSAGVYYPFLMYYTQASATFSLQFAYQLPGETASLTALNSGFFWSNFSSCASTNVRVNGTCCSFTQNSGNVCCAPGYSPIMGASVSGVCCLNTQMASSSLCCGAGTTPVVSTCCNNSQVLNPVTCCSSGYTAVAGVCCLNSQVSGSLCCPSGQSPSNGACIWTTTTTSTTSTSSSTSTSTSSTSTTSTTSVNFSTGVSTSSIVARTSVDTSVSITNVTSAGLESGTLSSFSASGVSTTSFSTSTLTSTTTLNVNSISSETSNSFSTSIATPTTNSSSVPGSMSQSSVATSTSTTIVLTYTPPATLLLLVAGSASNLLHLNSSSSEFKLVYLNYTVVPGSSGALLNATISESDNNTLGMSVPIQSLLASIPISYVLGNLNTPFQNTTINDTIPILDGVNASYSGNFQLIVSITSGMMVIIRCYLISTNGSYITSTNLSSVLGGIYQYSVNVGDSIQICQVDYNPTTLASSANQLQLAISTNSITNVSYLGVAISSNVFQVSIELPLTNVSTLGNVNITGLSLIGATGQSTSLFGASLNISQSLSASSGQTVAIGNIGVSSAGYVSANLSVPVQIQNINTAPETSNTLQSSGTSTIVTPPTGPETSSTSSTAIIIGAAAGGGFLLIGGVAAASVYIYRKRKRRAEIQVLPSIHIHVGPSSTNKKLGGPPYGGNDKSNGKQNGGFIDAWAEI